MTSRSASFSKSNVAKIAVLSLLYVATSQATTIGFSNRNLPVLVWPAAGLSLASLVAWGPRLWPGVLIGAMIDGHLSELSPWMLVYEAVGKTISALIGLWLLRKVDFDEALTRPRHYLWLTGVGALSTMVSGFTGASALTLNGDKTLAEAPLVFLSWCQGDTLGIVIFAPFLLVWRTLPRDWFTSPLRSLETVCCFGLAVLVGQFIFLGWLHEWLGIFAQNYWMFLFVTWGAVSYGRRGSVLICTTTGIQALAGSIMHYSHSAAELETELLNFWFYMFALNMVGLMLALMIHDRKRGQERLADAKLAAENANRLKSEFLANTSHEIRTPMNAILGFSHLALKTSLTPKQLDYLTKIQSAAGSLLNVINDILDLSKIEAGKLDVEFISFDLTQVLEDVAGTAAFKARERGLELVFQIAEDTPRGLVGDPFRLGQVLLNLTNNAIKFTERGEVVVTVCPAPDAPPFESEPARTLLFTVRDTGMGMTAEGLGRLFEAFTQADGSTTRKYGGTGLGLSICRQLVQLLGGEIHVESEPGVGSSFSFTIPFAVDHSNAGRHLALPRKIQALRVLVVDDNESVRETLRTEMVAMRLSVTTASSGQAGLAELKRAEAAGEPYDLVLLDQRMPGLDGVQTAQRIHSDLQLSKQPILFLLTGDERDEDRAPAESGGFGATLMKPITPSALFDQIVSTFGPPAAPAEPNALGAKVQSPLLGARVLVVEDNTINQQVIRELLEGWGAKVDMASGGQEALDMLAAASDNQHDVILMDVQMPVMGGFETTHRIRKDLCQMTVPIIAVTADALEREREKCLAAGMNDHVPKPIEPDRLLATLLIWIDDSRLLRPDSVSQAQPRPSSEGFPELPGVDTASALARVSGNARLLRNLLIEFRQNWSDVIPRFQAAIDADHLAEALHLAHTLKGLAATLSMPEVTVAAEVLESHMRRTDLAAVPADLSDLEAAMRVVLLGLVELDRKDANTPVRAGQQHDPAAVATTLERLAALLRDNDLEAAERVGDLKELLAEPGPWSEPAALLYQDVDQLDFAGARRSLEKLAKALERAGGGAEDGKADDPGYR